MHKDITIDFRDCEDKQTKMKECLLKLKEMGENVDTKCSSSTAHQCNYVCKVANVYMAYIKPKDNIITYEEFLNGYISKKNK